MARAASISASTGGSTRPKPSAKAGKWPTTFTRTRSSRCVPRPRTRESRLPVGLSFGYRPGVMATTVLVGAQWGDEGKGKIIDVLTEQADVVVRYQGGNNAGHTVEVG